MFESNQFEHIMKNLISVISIVLFCHIAIQSSAQNIGINDDGSTPNASAILDIKATNKGLLIPRLSDAQMNAVASPANGLLIFNSSHNSFWFRQGGVWVELLSDHVNELVDADGDTKVQVEESADEDIIRMDISGTEALVLSKSSNGELLIENSIGNSLTLGRNAAVNMISNCLRNTTIGIGAGQFANNTSNNVFVGYMAGRHQPFGSRNTFLGCDAGFSSSGFDNIYIGYLAGSATSIASNNIYIGSDAGAGLSGGHKLVIDNSLNGGSPLIYGEFDNDLLRINGTLEIGTQYSFPPLAGSVGQVLTFGLGGLTSWESPSDNVNDADSNPLNEVNTTLSLIGDIVQLSDPGGVLTVDLSHFIEDQPFIQDADKDTKIQVEEIADEDVIRFDLAGLETLIHDRTSALQSPRLRFIDPALKL